MSQFPIEIEIIYTGRNSQGQHVFKKTDESESDLVFSKNMGAKHIGAVYTLTQTDKNTFMQNAKFQEQLDNDDCDWSEEIKEWRARDAVAGVRLQEKRVQNKLAKEIELDFWEKLSIGELANMARTWNRTERRLLIARIAQEIENRWD